jgi:hypothetical protein
MTRSTLGNGSSGFSSCSAPKLASCLQIVDFLAMRTEFWHPTGSGAGLTDLCQEVDADAHEQRERSGWNA